MDFLATYQLPTYQLPPGSLTAHGLCHAFSHIAGLHAKALGIFDDPSAELDSGWVILSLSLRVVDATPVDRPVCLETWVASVEGATMVREFRVVTQENSGARKLLAEAAQGFVLFDRKSRRPILLSRDKRHLLRGGGRRFSFALSINRKDVETMNLKNPFELKTVTSDDVDHNGHLNNAKYLEWIAGTIGYDRILKYELLMHYVREARLNDTVRIEEQFLSGVDLGTAYASAKNFSFFDLKTQAWSARLVLLSVLRGSDLA